MSACVRCKPSVDTHMLLYQRSITPRQLKRTKSTFHHFYTVHRDFNGHQLRFRFIRCCCWCTRRRQMLLRCILFHIELSFLFWCSIFNVVSVSTAVVFVRDASHHFFSERFDCVFIDIDFSFHDVHLRYETTFAFKVRPIFIRFGVYLCRQNLDRLPIAIVRGLGFDLDIFHDTLVLHNWHKKLWFICGTGSLAFLLHIFVMILVFGNWKDNTKDQTTWIDWNIHSESDVLMERTLRCGWSKWNSQPTLCGSAI